MIFPVVVVTITGVAVSVLVKRVLGWKVSGWAYAVLLVVSVVGVLLVWGYPVVLLVAPWWAGYVVGAPWVSEVEDVMRRGMARAQRLRGRQDFSESLGSYRQMGSGHPGVAHPSPSWKPLAFNSTANAGLVALSDVAKKYGVDRLLSFEGAPAYPVPSPGPSPVPLSVGSDGFGVSGGEVQVLDPENIREPDNVQTSEDIRVPERVQEPDYAYPIEGVYIPADAQPEEGLTQGQNLDEVDEGVSDGLSQDGWEVESE